MSRHHDSSDRLCKDVSTGIPQIESQSNSFHQLAGWSACLNLTSFQECLIYDPSVHNDPTIRCISGDWMVTARPRWEYQRGAGFKPIDSTWSSLTFISSKMAKDFDFSFHFGLILVVTVQQNRFLEASHSFYNTLINNPVPVFLKVSESFNEKKKS